MKRYFAFILFLGFGLNASFGQIDQKNLRLSSYIKIHFPYEDVKENFCSDQFVGLFYVSFQIDKNGQCYDINFYGIENLKVISALTKLMQKENTRFDTSFAKKMFQKKLLQPIFYSYSNCVQDSLAHFKPGLNIQDEEKQLYEEALYMLGRMNSKMTKSIEKGSPFPDSNDYFDGIMLSPCVIDTDPKTQPRKTM